jgi:hypothetical protein
MPSNDLIQYEKFQWHMGVVEDRKDPLRLGRVKVRFIGVHSDDLSKVPTESLPWASLINSPNNAATSGIGGPVTGIVEGAWVVGFFMDQGQYQKPMIMGTISGAPINAPKTDKGFNDPNGLYPRTTNPDLNGLNEPDITRLARGEKAEDHLVLKSKRVSRVEKIPTAKAPEITLQDNKEGVDYENKTWDEPHPRSFEKETDRKKYKSVYPYNHVYESESGHVMEVDDTPEAERLHWYHKSGTFVEVMPDGSKSAKIIGSDYEITLKDKDLQVSGNLNITVNGDAKFLVKGNKYEEIDGTYFLTVRKDKIEKIGGNHLTEILTDRSTQVNGNNALRVTGNDIRTIDGSETITVGSTHTETITGNTSYTILSNRKTIVGGTDTTVGAKTGDYGYANNLNMGSAKNVNVKAENDMKLDSANNQSFTVGASQTMSVNTTQTMTIGSNQDITATITNINNDVNVDGTVDASTEVKAGEVEVTLTGHIHPETGANTGTGVG